MRKGIKVKRGMKYDNKLLILEIYTKLSINRTEVNKGIGPVF